MIDAAPGLQTGAIDEDGDSFVILGTAPPSNGTATVHPNGSLIYQPDPDFFGTDVFTVLAHDGRDHSGTVSVRVEVLPVPDAPTGISVNLNPIPENALPGHILGPIDIIDVDLNDNNQIELGDPRFIINNGQIIFVEGSLNFEDEPIVGIQVNVSFPEYPGYLYENIFVEVLNANDPITDIGPHRADVYENEPGASVTQLHVEDEDLDADATLTVDDDRFVIVNNNELRLAEGVALDYEATPVVSVNVTATDGDSFTQEIEIDVRNQAEPTISIGLSNQSVLEYSPGNEVGIISINGQQALDSYTMFVNDPRFEIVDSELKLIDDQYVERATQEEIQLTITAQDTDKAFEAKSQTFVIEVVANPTPYHNDESPFDVDGNDFVSAADALVIINYLNIYSPGPVGFGDPMYGYDVNGDGFVTALDALLILNELSVQSVSSTVGGEKEKDGPEGEQVQPEQIAPLQPENLILPQRIAVEAELQDDNYQDYYAATDISQTEKRASASAAKSAVIASDYERDYEVPSAYASDTTSDEASQRIDEALQSVIRNDYQG